MDQSPTTEQRIISRVLIAVLSLVIVIFLTMLISVIQTVRHRTALVENLGRFDGTSVQASYDPYDYQQRLEMRRHELGGLIYHGGERFSGYSFGVGGNGPVWANWFTIISDYAPFAEIQIVSIHDERFFDADLSLLLKIPSLRELDLSMTQVTDEGVVLIIANANLAKLDLSHTQISDRSLLTLDNLPNLCELDIVKTKVTKRALEEYRKRHPDCLVLD